MQPIDGAPIFVSRCVFLDGEHMFPGPDCPHGRTTDEEGEIPPVGWTVQQ